MLLFKSGIFQNVLNNSQDSQKFSNLEHSLVPPGKGLSWQIGEALVDLEDGEDQVGESQQAEQGEPLTIFFILHR